MKHFLYSFAVITFVIGFSFHAAAQTTNYNPYQAFDPLFSFQPATAYRSADGQPGPNYWTNRTDYQIHAHLDTLQKKITANEVITYTNNSPHVLSYVWLQLDQNRYNLDSRSTATAGQTFNNERFNGGYKFQSVSVQLDEKSIPADYIITDTRMQIRLPKNLAAKGGKLKIKIDYSYTIPPNGYGRNGWMNTKNGTIYEIAQWFPRMIIYF